MSILTNTRIALETELLAFATTNNLEVAWPNTPYESADDIFLTPNILFSETAMLGLASASEDDYRGIFQVDVRVKKGGGDSGRTTVDNLLAAFSKADTLTSGSAVVKLEQRWASPTFEIDDYWYVTPISIRFRVIG